MSNTDLSTLKDEHEIARLLIRWGHARVFSGPWIRVNRNRAFSRCHVSLCSRIILDGHEFDLQSWFCFFDLLERRDGVWRIVRRTGAYEKDRIDLVETIDRCLCGACGLTSRFCLPCRGRRTLLPGLLEGSNRIGDVGAQLPERAAVGRNKGGVASALRYANPFGEGPSGELPRTEPVLQANGLSEFSHQGFTILMF
jgi:hypothetical protein